MVIFLKVLQIFGMILFIFGATFGAYILFDKVKKLKDLKTSYKHLIIGGFFSIVTMLCFWMGVRYNPIYVKTLGKSITVNSSFGCVNCVPFAVALVFGWQPTLMVGVIGAIFRTISYGFAYENGVFINDPYKFAEVATFLISAFIAFLCSYFLFRKKKARWSMGILLGLLIETIHMSLIYFFSFSLKYGNDFGYLVVKQADYKCVFASVVTLVAIGIAITIYDKEKIHISILDKKLEVIIKRSLIGAFILSIILSSTLVSLSGSYQEKRQLDNIMDTCIQDTITDLNKNSQWYDSKAPNTALLKQLVLYNHFENDGVLMIINRPEEDGDAKGRVLSCSGEYIDEFYNTFFYFCEEKDGDKKNYLVGNETKYESNNLSTAYLNIVSGETQSKAITKFYYKYGWTRDETVGGDDQSPCDYYVIALIPSDSLTNVVQSDLRFSLYVITIIFLGLYLICFIFIESKILHPIRSINNSLQIITNGNLNEVVMSKTSEDFERLSNGINSTVDSLKQLIDKVKKDAEKDLKLARLIQSTYLPRFFPSTKKYDLHAAMKTAKDVGGDFYDFFMIDKERLLFLIADVSGKGVPAALFMMRVKTLIKTLAETGELSIDMIITSVNDELCANNDAGMFVTCWAAILNVNTGLLQFTNGGHNPPLVKVGSDKFKYLTMKKNFVLGVMPDVMFEAEEIQLSKGDEIFIYTDGVTEAMDANKALYSEERLLNFVNTVDYEYSSGLITKVMHELDEYQKGVDQADDITMVVVRYTNDGNSDEE